MNVHSASTRPVDAIIGQVLIQWGIDRFRVEGNLGGSSQANWLIATPRGRYVLRRITHDREYLDYQIMVITHLASSDFPYEVPTIVRPNTSSSPYVAEAGNCWLLYRFIVGEPYSRQAGSTRARQLGTLAAHYDRTLAIFDLGAFTGHFSRKPIEIQRTADRLSEGARWVSARQDLRRIREVLLENFGTVLSACFRMPPSEVEEVSRLPEITIYNDWHFGNILARLGRIEGLVDFDSVIEAPRIVDFQNALTYALIGGKFSADDELVSAFADAYYDVLPLSAVERELVYPVMLHRVAWLVANILDEYRENRGRPSQALIIRLIQLCRWLMEHRERVLGALRAA